MRENNGRESGPFAASPEMGERIVRQIEMQTKS